MFIIFGPRFCRNGRGEKPENVFFRFFVFQYFSVFSVWGVGLGVFRIQKCSVSGVFSAERTGEKKTKKISTEKSFFLHFFSGGVGLGVFWIQAFFCSSVFFVSFLFFLFFLFLGLSLLKGPGRENRKKAFLPRFFSVFLSGGSRSGGFLDPGFFLFFVFFSVFFFCFWLLFFCLKGRGENIIFLNDKSVFSFFCFLSGGSVWGFSNDKCSTIRHKPLLTPMRKFFPWGSVSRCARACITYAEHKQPSDAFVCPCLHHTSDALCQQNASDDVFEPSAFQILRVGSLLSVAGSTTTKGGLATIAASSTLGFHHRCLTALRTNTDLLHLQDG